jgi:hypothetical protein
MFPMILYIASVIENRPILIYLETVVHSKLNQLLSWKNIKQTYHLGHKVINCTFHGQNVSSPSKAFTKRITEKNLLLLAYLAKHMQAFYNLNYCNNWAKKIVYAIQFLNLFIIYLIIWSVINFFLKISVFWGVIPCRVVYRYK